MPTASAVVILHGPTHQRKLKRDNRVDLSPGILPWSAAMIRTTLEDWGGALSNSKVQGCENIQRDASSDSFNIKGGF